MTEPPLSTLLSQALVAWVIEADNAFEARMPHLTSVYGPTAGQPAGPWLTSVAMWFGCLRFLADDGITVGELERRARGSTNLAGMRQWQYLTVEPEPVRHVFRAPMTLRPTPSGRQARAVWEEVLPEVDTRWQERFGTGPLRERLAALDGQVGAGLPDFLPVLGHGLWNQVPQTEPGQDGPDEPPDGALVALLARTLLALALEFERASPVSLAVAANPLRVLDAGGVPARDLPALTGVATDGLSAALGVLERQGLAEIGSTRHWKQVRLSPVGERVRAKAGRLLRGVEDDWQARFGLDGLRACLGPIVGDGSPTASPLAAGLVPHRDGWRARVDPASTLPHYPFVLPRGGFPDGS